MILSIDHPQMDQMQTQRRITNSSSPFSAVVQGRLNDGQMWQAAHFHASSSGSGERRGRDSRWGEDTVVDEPCGRVEFRVQLADLETEGVLCGNDFKEAETDDGLVTNMSVIK